MWRLDEIDNATRCVLIREGQDEEIFEIEV